MTKQTRGISERDWAKAMDAAERECGRLTFPTFAAGAGLFVLAVVGAVLAIILGGV